MGGLTISNKILDKYFGYLKNLDSKSKKSLINKLTESLETKSKKDTVRPSGGFDLNKMFGAWNDNRDSDEIIAEIKSSRVHKINTESFE